MTIVIQVSLGPFTVVESIDRLTRALADSLFAEGRGFSLSTNNIGDETHLLLWVGEFSVAL